MNKYSYIILISIIVLVAFNVLNNSYIDNLEKKNIKLKEFLNESIKERKDDILFLKKYYYSFSSKHNTKIDIIEEKFWLTNPDFDIFVDSSLIMLNSNLKHLESDLNISSTEYQKNNIEYKYFYILERLRSLLKNIKYSGFHKREIRDFFIAIKVFNNKDSELEFKIIPVSYIKVTQSFKVWNGNQELEISQVPFHYTNSPKKLKLELINPILQTSRFINYE